MKNLQTGTTCLSKLPAASSTNAKGLYCDSPHS